MGTKNRIYTKELIEEAIIGSINIADVCRKLGCRITGGSYELVKNRIKEYNLDTSHFLGKASFGGKRNPNYNKRKSKEVILTDGYIYRASHLTLKRALLESGIVYKCSECEIETWRGEKITLDIDHINGDWSDCKLQNLRFLCPNCHRQTKTFGIGAFRCNS